MFSCSLAGPVPSEGSVQPEWSSGGKLDGGMTNGFDCKQAGFQMRKGWVSALVLPTPETGDTDLARRAAAQSGWANGVGLSSRPTQVPPAAARTQGIPGPRQDGSLLQRW